MKGDTAASSEETGVSKQMKSVVSYQVFVLEQKNKLQGKYPFLKAQQINRKLKLMWDTLPLDARSNYRKFTLISTPTPPKKVAKKISIKRSKTCKGRLLTPKSCITFSAKKTKQSPAKSNESPIKPIQDIQTNPFILDQWDQNLLGPYHNSDDDMSDGGYNEDDICDTASPISTSPPALGLPTHWENKVKTYSVGHSVEKNYAVPTVVGMSSENAARTPGILKRNGKENKRPASRVSFSAEEVDVKIMSEIDSCSTISASQDQSMPSPKTLPKSDENPYDFDAIDQFEICVSSPQKFGNGSRIKQSPKEKSPVVGKLTSKPVRKNVSASPKHTCTLQRSGSRKNSLSSPSVPAKRMLRSRSPNMSKSATPDQAAGTKYVYKFDEMSSPQCPDGEMGRGDAEGSFHETEGHTEFAGVKGNRRGKQCFVHSGGDSQSSSQLDSSQITPKLDNKTQSSVVAVAPKKRKPLSRSSSVTTPKHVLNVISKLKDSASVERRRSPRFNTPAECSETPPKIRETLVAKKKIKAKIVEMTKNMDILDSKKDNFDIFGNLAEQENPWITTDAECPIRTGYVEDDSSDSDVGLSPVLLQAKSQLSVAETLRGFKMITSPDNQDLSDSSVDCPKLQSPTLSDISLLSSVSSTAGNDGKGCTASKSGIIASSDTFQVLRRQQKRIPQQPPSHELPREPLCDMFENLTPPDQQILSSRKLLSSSGREGTSNFGKLFEEENIFG